MDIEKRHIEVWGDSILKGVVLDESSLSYRTLSENCVARFAQATKTDITNHASFGMTSLKAHERILKAVERNPPKSDDIVLVEFGGNDCDFHWSAISDRPDEYHEPKTPIAVFGKKMQEIIDTFRSFKIEPILMSLPPLEPNRYFEWISRGLNRANILKWLDDVNKIYRWQEAYNDIVVETAQSNGLRLIDVRKSFLVSDRYTSLICGDGIHPSARGHETIYNTFISYASDVTA
jgi:lysophospholipase L1-like esterase